MDPEPKPARPSRVKAALVALAAAVAAPAASTVLGQFVFGRTQLADVAMIFLLGIVLVSLRWGLVASSLAVVLSVLAFDFFFVPPFHTLAVADVSHLVTFAVMFVVATVITSLTRRVRDQARIASERELRVRTEQVKNALLSSVSHDLRTPLAVITGAASTLRDAAIDDSVRRELTETIVTEAERLNRLVRNLLDLTRLEAGAVEVQKEWQPLEEAIGAALERTSPLLADHPVTTEVPPDLPLVPFDSLLLQQALVNLLENAARHTPPGTPVRVAAVHRGGSVEIVIADRGPGLPPGAEPGVFDKLRRGGGRGAGLGLTICKGIAEAHGGRIWAERRPEGGASFHLALPIEGEPPSIVPETAPDRPAEAAP